MLRKLKFLFMLSIFGCCLSYVGVPQNTIRDCTAFYNTYISRPHSKTPVIDTIPTQLETDPLERTLILLKPDAIRRKLAGEIIKRFENKALKLIGMKMTLATRETIAIHYSEHHDRPLFGKLIGYMTSGPIIPMVWEGVDAIKVTRKMIGSFSTSMKYKGTIRGDLGIDYTQNLVHGSDSTDAANREINIWFHANEFF